VQRISWRQGTVDPAKESVASTGDHGRPLHAFGFLILAHSESMNESRIDLARRASAFLRSPWT
jgi:hypothetical protein